MKYDIKKMLSEIKTLPREDLLSYVQLQSWKENPSPSDAFEHVGGRNSWVPETKLDLAYTYKIFDIPYINSIIDELKLYKARITFLKEKECYTWHRDMHPKVQVPIVSDPFTCFMVVQSKFDKYDLGEIHRMPVGESYYIVTTLHHTAINGGIPERIHLIGTVTGP